MRLFLKILLGVVVVIVLVVGYGLFQAWRHGALRLLFPSDAYETQAPVIAADFGQDSAVRVLLYTKTNSFRHVEGIAAARTLFEDLAARRGWAVFATENSAVFDPAILGRFDVIVFANASGNHASDAQDETFRRWLEQGGGWLGIHAAGDASHSDWVWYQATLKSGEFIGHIMGPQTQEARVVVEDRDHPVTRGLPAEFRHEEEWYSWDRGAREAGFHVLLTVDESTYTPKIIGLGPERDIAMGDHPVVWSRCVDRGAAVYTAMGHWGAAYEKDYTQTLLGNAVDWLAGDTGCPSATTSDRAEGSPPTAGTLR